MKKILCFIILLLIIFQIGATASTKFSDDNVISLLSALKIMSGYPDGNFHKDEPLTRAQFAKIAVLSSPFRNSVSTKSDTSPFWDVPYTNWSAPYVKAAVVNKVLTGYPDGSFMPEKFVLLEEALTICLKLLGYTGNDITANWPNSQVELGRAIGILEGVNANIGSLISRIDAAKIIYNTLNTKLGLSEQKYIEKLGYKIIENADLISSNKNNPTLKENEVQTSVGTLIASSNFDFNLVSQSGELVTENGKKLILFTPKYKIFTLSDMSILNKIKNPTGINVIRDGKSTNLSDLQSNDIVYYFEASNTIWAYSKKITGVYEKATPSRESISSVVVSGISYSVETQTAIKKLSANGEFSIGDTVTLLIGKDGKIADVISPMLQKNNLYGYVISTGTKEYSDKNGEKRSGNYVKVVLMDGSQYDYITNFDYEDYRSSIVKITFENGFATLNKENTNSNLYGKFDYLKKSIAGNTISSDIKIIDIASQNIYKNGKYVFVNPQRIDNISLSVSDILFYQKNEKDEIVFLALNDVTGDYYKYGITLDAQSTSRGMSSSGSYKIDIGGTISNYNTTNVSFSISSGMPSKFEFEDNKLSHIGALESVKDKIISVDDVYLKTEKNTYILDSNLLVYKRNTDYTYTLAPKSEIFKDKISAYFDKPSENGGRIRVIIIN